MTHPLAALIAGVTRFNIKTGENTDPSVLLLEAEVLAALEAAPVPDLVEAGKVADRLRAEKSVISTTRTFPSGDERDMVLVPHYGPNPLAHEAADTIRALIVLATAQAAQIAGMGKERDEAREQARMNSFAGEGYVYMQRRAEAAEATAATLRAEVSALQAEIVSEERLRGAVLQKVAECLAGMTYREVSQEARARIKRALDAALEGKHE